MRVGFAVLYLATLAWAQKPTFDVASLKPSPPPEGDRILINLGTARHGEVKLTNTTLSDCIRFAYSLPSDDQVSGPDWIKTKTVTFDIDAKSSPDTPEEQLRLMTRTLLEERFHLAMHTEPKPFAHYALVVAKSGSKLQPAREDAPKARGYGIGRISSNGISMHTFTVLLSRQLRQAVLDQTGLKGTFDINLDWTPDPPRGAPDIETAPGPTIFTAIQEQLGLRLESRKDPVDVWVIDHADRTPVAN